MARSTLTTLPALRTTPGSPATILPRLVSDAGPAASFAWDEFFAGAIRNSHTRTAYLRAVRRFLAWLEPKELSLPEITPGMVGAYFDQHPGSPPTKKLHLAALRGFFDTLCLRHVVVLNPAASVRTERYQVVEGKTPEITVGQARTLLASIDTAGVVGRRDRAAIAILIYTAARVGAVAKLRMRHFSHDGSQYTLRFEEKGGKSREIPVRHDLEAFLLGYLAAAGIADAPRDTPLFRSALRRTGTLRTNPMTAVDMCRMVKRRLRDAGLPTRLSPHSFRVTTVTDLLTQGVSLEDVQYLAGYGELSITGVMAS